MLGYFVTACVACSAGVFIGGVFAGSKVTALYASLALAEKNLALQAKLIGELTEALRECVTLFDSRMSNFIAVDQLEPIRDRLGNFESLLSSARQGAPVGE